MTNDPQTARNLEAAYQRAALFQQEDFGSDNLVKNTKLISHWIDDTDCFWYQRDTASGTCFRIVNAKTKTNEDAFDHQRLANALASVSKQQVDANNLPLTKISMTLQPAQLTFIAFDKRYCFKADTGQCTEIEPELAPYSRTRLVSPDGKMIAFARDHNLWIQDVQTGEERALTTDGEQYYGYAASPLQWGYDLTGDLQARWSPDSKTLFTLQLDNRQVKRTPIVHFVPEDGSIRPTVVEYPCGYPGDEHVEEQRILAINVETGAQKDANYRRLPATRSALGLFTDNLAWWSKDSLHAYFVDLERGYKQVRMVEFDTATGATRILFEETSSTYLNLSPSEMTYATLLPLPDSNELIWFSERTGWGHLYLYDLTTGALKYAITEGEWMVREILHFDNERRELWFQAGGRSEGINPYYLDICRVNIDTRVVDVIASSNHEYKVIGSLGGSTTYTHLINYFDPELRASGVSPSADYLLTTRSRADEAPISLLLDRNGTVLLEVEVSDTSGLPTNWQWPEPVKLIAADGKTDMYGVIFRPSDFDPHKKYPVIDCSMCTAEYSGVPTGSFFSAFMGGFLYKDTAALAELGFIVIMLDGRGGAYRDRSFVDTSYGWIPSSNNTEDRIAGIKQLAKRYQFIDLERIGIFGSAGDVSAVYSMLEHPEFYKVGVSHALQDTRVMPTVWGEQYEGLESPEDHHCYAEKLASNLQGKLLLMHGLLDRFDHCAATFRLVDALQEANKDFDMLILPKEGISTAHIDSDYAFRRTWDYFVKHLQGVEPPKEFSIGGAIG